MNEQQLETLKVTLRHSIFLDEWLGESGAQFMRERRGRKGVREFAREIRVSPTLVSRIEHGKAKMGRPTLQKLLDRMS